MASRFDTNSGEQLNSGSTTYQVDEPFQYGGGNRLPPPGSTIGSSPEFDGSQRFLISFLHNQVKHSNDVVISSYQGTHLGQVQNSLAIIWLETPGNPDQPLLVSNPASSEVTLLKLLRNELKEHNHLELVKLESVRSYFREEHQKLLSDTKAILVRTTGEQKNAFDVMDEVTFIVKNLELQNQPINQISVRNLPKNIADSETYSFRSLSSILHESAGGLTTALLSTSNQDKNAELRVQLFNIIMPRISEYITGAWSDGSGFNYNLSDAKSALSIIGQNNELTDAEKVRPWIDAVTDDLLTHSAERISKYLDCQARYKTKLILSAAVSHFMLERWLQLIEIK